MEGSGEICSLSRCSLSYFALFEVDSDEDDDDYSIIYKPTSSELEEGKLGKVQHQMPLRDIFARGLWA
jgi:hypothetical protein